MKTRRKGRIQKSRQGSRFSRALGLGSRMWGLQVRSVRVFRSGVKVLG